MTAAKSIELAQADVDAARARLFRTLEQIQSQVSPSRLMEDVVDNVRAGSATAVQTAGEVVRNRPGAVAGAAAAGALILAHKPLLRLGQRLFGRRKTHRPLIKETQTPLLGSNRDAPHPKG